MQIMNIKSLIGEYTVFLDKIFAQLKAAGFADDEFIELDHLCYRTDSRESYDHLKKQFSAVAELLGENMVSQRPIAVFKLSPPLGYRHWQIPALELPAPKVGDHHKNGLQHIEFVIRDSFTDFMQKHPQIKFNTEAITRAENPELIWEILPNEVKFHQRALLNLFS